MTIVERPNQEALSKAINIYLDAFRPFLTRNLKQVSGRTVEEALLQSLPPDKAEYIVQNLPETVDPESAIEVSHVEFIMSHYWKEVFAPLFRNCDVTFVKIRCATVARNQVSHPAYRRDLDDIETLENLDALVYLLRAIGASEESEAVANIRAALENPEEQKKKAEEEFARLEEQYEKTVVALGETEGFLWKAESDLNAAGSKLERAESARRKAEKGAQVAQALLCQTVEVLKKEVAGRSGTEGLAEEKARARQIAEHANLQGRRVLNQTVRHLSAAMARLVKAKRRAMLRGKVNRRVIPWHNSFRATGRISVGQRSTNNDSLTRVSAGG